MIESIIKPLRPKNPHGNQWKEIPGIVEELAQAGYPTGYPIERWRHFGYGFTVLSAVEVAVERDGSSNGPEYHIRISKATPGGSYRPTRVDTNDAKWVLAEFGVDGAEEDNHVPYGVVRNFWRPVAEGLVGKECKCKAEEVVIREMKGDFIWRP